MNIMRRISKEYNEPFVDVVKGFAAMRCGKSETARTLGMSVVWFHKLCTRFNLHKYFYHMSELREGTWKGTTGVNQKFSDEEVLTAVAKYDTISEFCKHSGISKTVVYKRFGNFTEARKLGEVL